MILTGVSFIVVLAVGFADTGTLQLSNTLDWWNDGLWNAGLMQFAMQMMLMLVLGHVLALSPPVRRLIDVLVMQCTNTARAALVVSLCAMTVALFNWGLGLIFGAILARRVGEHAAKQNLPLNYSIVGAAGYSVRISRFLVTS